MKKHIFIFLTLIMSLNIFTSDLQRPGVLPPVQALTAPNTDLVRTRRMEIAIRYNAGRRLGNPEMLLADCEHVDTNCNNALHFLASMGQIDPMPFLNEINPLQLGNLVYGVNNNGDNPLHIACKKLNLRLIEFFDKRFGSAFKVKNMQGRSPALEMVLAAFKEGKPITMTSFIQKSDIDEIEKILKFCIRMLNFDKKDYKGVAVSLLCDLLRINDLVIPDKIQIPSVICSQDYIDLLIQNLSTDTFTGEVQEGDPLDVILKFLTGYSLTCEILNSLGSKINSSDGALKFLKFIIQYTSTFREYKKYKNQQHQVENDFYLDRSIVTDLLNKISDINKKDEDGNTLLDLACKYHCEDIIEAILGREGVDFSPTSLSLFCDHQMGLNNCIYVVETFAPLVRVHFEPFNLEKLISVFNILVKKYQPLELNKCLYKFLDFLREGQYFLRNKFRLDSSIGRDCDDYDWAFEQNSNYKLTIYKFVYDCVIVLLNNPRTNLDYSEDGQKTIGELVLETNDKVILNLAAKKIEVINKLEHESSGDKSDLLEKRRREFSCALL